MKARSKSRNGTLIVCVLVCLLVASTMVTATTHSALRSRRDVRIRYQMRQTELLLDAGVLRAAKQLEKSDQYDGETWRPTTAVTRFDHALVEIRITAGDRGDDDRRVEVIASLGVAADDLPSKRTAATRRTHTFRVEPSDNSRTSESSSAE